MNIGMCSIHTDIQNTFKITAIKFKVTEKIVTKIHWKIIGYHKTTNEIFSNTLSMSLDGITTYSNFKNYILQAGAATTTTRNKNKKGLFHFSLNSLLTLIDIRDILYLNIGPSVFEKEDRHRQSYN